MSDHRVGEEAKETNDSVADASAGNWVDRYAPTPWRPYLRLSRADRPIGTWLLWLPCVFGALLASAEVGSLSASTVWIIAASAMGAFLMRGAGCTWNDLTDQDIDAKVERTKSRPLPAGQVSRKAAYAWMVAQALIAFAILLTFPPIAIWLGIASLIPVAIYPFAKRFTWWPQVFLGIAFNWGALLCYAAVSGEISSGTVLLYLACISWTLFYDTIYALQDTEDDALIGVKSTARLFADQTPVWLKRFLVITVVLLAGAVIDTIADRSVLALIVASCGIWAMGLHLTAQLGRVRLDEPATCLKLFRSNREAGLILSLFFAVSVFI